MGVDGAPHPTPRHPYPTPTRHAGVHARLRSTRSATGHPAAPVPEATACLTSCRRNRRRYGVLDYDTYEQLLAACCQLYGAQYVRLPGLDPDSVAALGAAARAAAGAEGEGGGSGGGSRQQRGGVAAGDVAAGGDGEGSGGGLAGLPMQAVEVEAEVVLD